MIKKTNLIMIIALFFTIGTCVYAEEEDIAYADGDSRSPVIDNSSIDLPTEYLNDSMVMNDNNSNGNYYNKNGDGSSNEFDSNKKILGESITTQTFDNGDLENKISLLIMSQIFLFLIVVFLIVFIFIEYKKSK